jgi:hypothetical protein
MSNSPQVQKRGYWKLAGKTYVRTVFRLNSPHALRLLFSAAAAGYGPSFFSFFRFSWLIFKGPPHSVSTFSFTCDPISSPRNGADFHKTAEWLVTTCTAATECKGKK